MYDIIFNDIVYDGNKCLGILTFRSMMLEHFAEIVEVIFRIWEFYFRSIDGENVVAIPRLPLLKISVEDRRGEGEEFEEERMRYSLPCTGDSLFGYLTRKASDIVQ